MRRGRFSGTAGRGRRPPRDLNPQEPDRAGGRRPGRPATSVEYGGRGHSRPLSMDGPHDGLETCPIEWGARAGIDRPPTRRHIRVSRGPGRGVHGEVRRARRALGRLPPIRRRCRASNAEVARRRRPRWRRRSTWGTNPRPDRTDQRARVPEPSDDGERRRARIHGPDAGTPPARTSPIRTASSSAAARTVVLAEPASGRPERSCAGETRWRRGVRAALVVPGFDGGQAAPAESEGLDRGVHGRGGSSGGNAGCSMCLGMKSGRRRPRGEASGLDEQSQLRGASGPGVLARI